MHVIILYQENLAFCFFKYAPFPASFIYFRSFWASKKALLEISNSYVDKWIILEGNKTFSGKPKKFNLKNNLHQFEKFKDKIILMNLEIPEGYKDWKCDNYSRISIQEEINKLQLYL